MKAKFPAAVVVAVAPKPGGQADANGQVVSRTKYGTARKLEGAKPTRAQLDESRRALNKIVNSKGQAYVDSQRNLPDQIIIP